MHVRSKKRLQPAPRESLGDGHLVLDPGRIFSRMSALPISFLALVVGKKSSERQLETLRVPTQQEDAAGRTHRVLLKHCSSLGSAIGHVTFMPTESCLLKPKLPEVWTPLYDLASSVLNS